MLLLALDRQLAHIEGNLSYYFSPNTHLLGEALALYVAGQSLPLLSSASRYAATGRRVLVEQVRQQIAPDGGHAERSTHYHRYTLDFYVLALAVARITNDTEAIDAFSDAVTRLGRAARLLADHRGRLPHIGDDDGGMLLPICGRVPRRSARQPDGGRARWSTARSSGWAKHRRKPSGCSPIHSSTPASSAPGPCRRSTARRRRHSLTPATTCRARGLAITWSSTPDRTASPTVVMPTPMRCRSPLACAACRC